jgi:hypothetical protein
MLASPASPRVSYQPAGFALLAFSIAMTGVEMRLENRRDQN